MDNCVTYYEKEWFEDVEDIIFEGVKTKIPSSGLKRYWKKNMETI